VSRGKSQNAARPPAFVYQTAGRGFLRMRAGSELFCERVRLAELAQRFGTPLYVYSSSTVRSRLQEFDAAFRRIPHTICYSVKANSTLGILRLLAKMDCGFDVVSGGELERVLKADRRASRKVVFSGVGKTREEMAAALKAGILLFNVESESELAALAECAARLKKTARIALRVNPDVPANTHPYISTGLHKHKFGVPIGDARRLYAQASIMRFLKVAGVSVHIGSQIMDVEPFRAAMDRVATLVRTLHADGHQIEYVDGGGGLGIDYESSTRPEFSNYVSDYANALVRPLRGLGVHLLLEPGRAIIGPAGTLLTAVLYRKTNDGKKFVVVDAAMNDLLRPSLYGAYHEIVPVSVGRDFSGARETVDIVGPVCESGDFLAKDRKLPLLNEGDLLAVLDTGAYGMVLASNYNTRPRPAEVLVDGRTAKLIRRREPLADLYRHEI
jgi:diaminopimelate decarboxylase